MLGVLAGSVFSALAGIVAFLYYFKRGEFDHIEDAKYQVFRDEE